MDGILVVDKPGGKTSHDIVSRVRRLASQKKVGHTGTLDPMATGVLVLLLGKATRIGQFLDLEPKEYIAEALFGIVTDTQDITGEVLGESDEVVSQDSIERIIPDFSGEIDQIPPMVSAIKIGGQTLYKLARKGIEVERPSRRITIFELEMTDYRVENGKALATLRVVCSSGTYVRTLVHDIGQRLGVGATLNRLRRTQVGRFSIKDAVAPDNLAPGNTSDAHRNREYLEKQLIPMVDALDNIPCLIVKQEKVALLLNGRELDADSFHQPEPKPLTEAQAQSDRIPVRLTDPDGSLLAIGRVTAGDYEILTGVKESVDIKESADIIKQSTRLQTDTHTNLVRVQPQIVLK